VQQASRARRAAAVMSSAVYFMHGLALTFGRPRRYWVCKSVHAPNAPSVQEGLSDPVESPPARTAAAEPLPRRKGRYIVAFGGLLGRCGAISVLAVVLSENSFLLPHRTEAVHNR